MWNLPALPTRPLLGDSAAETPSTAAIRCSTKVMVCSASSSWCLWDLGAVCSDSSLAVLLSSVVNDESDLSLHRCSLQSPVHCLWT